ncbi:uncharacterized protein B0H18DRAFT_1123700 [Fomitopsis serialis]|uniref:uncharacterized protein n=1 Tax=Fomitopsis serialis TaxID=139415 RepID=UPI002007A826|nr:uncharacterized protein B0H18DRAFT_1123700 [Neoantrodia serialis]KAH9917245.1 hypothetical protein B0H18DRAFT_1123700 [Neoantrodia serialis]
MTLSSSIITEPDGSVFTSYTTLVLPLTYYGPSIPLDSAWTYGGLTPPPSTSAAPTSASPSSTVSPSSAPSSSSMLSSSPTPSSTSTSSASSSIPPSTSMTSTSSASASATSSAAAAGAHTSRSATILGAVLGSLLGTLILVLLILIWLLLRRHYRGVRTTTDPPSKSASSSFWNRSTTVFSRRKSRRQTPIWTEWQMVNPEDFEDRLPQSPTSPRSPEEGTPRDSGDETDPFLNRTVRGANEMSQTQSGTDTLVSVPAAAALAAGTGSTRRPGTTTHVGGPIMPREELLARMNEEDAAMPQVRLVSPSTDEHTSPLLPPPPLGSDRRSMRAARPSFIETKSMRSLASAAFSGSSEKSGSIDAQEQERAELLTARRVKVSNYSQPTSDAGNSSIMSGTSGLERLANLPRMSWFRRMSFLPPPMGSRPSSREGAEGDRYTRTPPRSHSRQGSRSRPLSWAPLPTHEPTSPTPDSSGSRRPRPPSSFPQGLGLLIGGERPVSSVSAKSRASVSTVYHDARETPSSSLVDVSVTPAGTFGSNRSQPGIPPVPPLPQARTAPVSPLAELTPEIATRGGYLDIPAYEPPTYEESHRDSPHSSGDSGPGDTVDVLDMPVPRPASPFTAASGSSRTQPPPGLPNPSVWRDSHATTDGTSSTSGIRIDVLEEAPPPAQDGWRTLSGNVGAAAPGGRRTTFGVPMVIHRDALQSERGSLASGRSHLTPHVLHSSGSTAASLHTHHSSSSKSHSQGPSGSSGSRSVSHAGSVGERRLEQVSETASPPLSAVFSREGAWSPTLPGVRPMSPIRQSPSSSAEEAPVLPEPRPATPTTAAGTVTSTTTSRTEDSGTHASVTTSGTDPVSGAVLHFPALPWYRPSEQGFVDSRRDDDLLW